MKIYTIEVDTPTIDSAINAIDEWRNTDPERKDFLDGLGAIIDDTVPIKEAFNELASTNQEFLDVVIKTMEDVDQLAYVLFDKVREIMEKDCTD